MTLIIGMTYKDEFALVSSDTKVTEQEHDAETFELDRSVSIKDAGFKRNKVHVLTDSVLQVTTGVEETGDAFDRELRKRVQPSYYLDDCIQPVQEVADELWSKRKSFHHGGMEDKKAMSYNFIGTGYFYCVLFGFFRNGNTGMVYLDPESITVKSIETTKDDTSPMTAVIISPSVDDNENYINWINIPIEERNINNFYLQMYLIHAKLSLKHSYSVSEDFNLKLMVNDGGVIKNDMLTLDSSELYPTLEENEGINHTKLFKLYKSL